MSKRHKHVNETVNEVIETSANEIKEEETMTEKKGFINTVKEFGNKIPKPVKTVGGVILTGAAAAGTALMIISKVHNEEIDSDDLDGIEADPEIEDAEADTSDAAEETSEA